MKERLVFDYTLESMLRVLGKPVPREYLPGLEALGIDARGPLQPAYPAELYSRLIDFITGQRWPGLARDAARFELGRAFMRAYQQTPMGRAVSSVSKFIGPRRSLERMNRNFRSANNFTETRLRQVAPNVYELWFNHDTQADFYRGLLTEALENTGARQLSVTLVPGGASGGSTFRIVWAEQLKGPSLWG